MFSRRSSSAYVLFLYGPMFAIYILSFQGPEGGLTFPMNGVSLHLVQQAVRRRGHRRHRRRLRALADLGLVVMVLTVVLSVRPAWRSADRSAAPRCCSIPRSPA